MTVNTFDFEGTNGATLAGTNIALQGTGTAIFDAAQAVVGGTGGKTTATDGLTRAARCTFATASSTYAVSAYIRTPAATSTIGTAVTMMTIRTATGIAIRVMYNPTSTTLGDIGVQGITGGFRTVATGLGLGVMIRWEINTVIGTNTVAPFNGTITAQAFSSGSNWTTSLGTFTNSVFDNGQAAIAAVDLGSLTALTPGMVVGFDYLRAADGQTTQFGPPAAVSGPTANAGPAQDVQEGTTVTLTAAASTAGSGTLTYQWGPATEIPTGAATPSLATPTAQTTTFVAATQGRYVIPVTVTQTGGLTSTASVTIYVYAPSNNAVRVYSVGTTTGTNEGGAANLLTALNDSSDATYFQSALSPVVTTDQLPVTANPFGPGVVTWSDDAYWVTAACTMRVRVYKADGTTVIGDTTHTLTSTKATYVTQVDETLIPAQSDRRALIIRHDFAVV
jgi:hypothetical protein